MKKLWAYNYWAWDHLLVSMRKISTDEYMKSRPFFWGSLHGLLSHSLGAEIIWIERLNGRSPDYLLGENEFQSLEEIIGRWDRVRADWLSYVNNVSQNQIESICSYVSTEGETRQNRVVDILQHVANHATDHRSQMTPILYRLNEPTPSLDFIFYCLSHPE